MMHQVKAELKPIPYNITCIIQMLIYICQYQGVYIKTTENYMTLKECCNQRIVCQMHLTVAAISIRYKTCFIQWYIAFIIWIKKEEEIQLTMTFQNCILSHKLWLISYLVQHFLKRLHLLLGASQYWTKSRNAGSAVVNSRCNVCCLRLVRKQRRLQLRETFVTSNERD